MTSSRGQSRRWADRVHAWLAVATVIGLLVATAAAFVITEKLKLTPSPILDTLVSKTFSPSCGCLTRSATVTFRLRRGGLANVDVIRPSGALVRQLARRHFPSGVVFFRWFGRDQTGHVSPDGDYRIRVRLFSQRRTIVLPNVIRLDTIPAKIERFRIERRFTLVGQRVRVDYVLGKVAFPILLVDGRVAVVGRFAHRSGTLDWFGKINRRPVRMGVHRLALEARDGAGNVSPTSASVVLRIRNRPQTRAHRRSAAKR